MTGVVCHYDPKGKFGFIKSPECPQTIFFHNSQQRSFYCDLDARIYNNGDCRDEPKVDDEVVVIAVEQMAKGPKARLWAKLKSKQEAEELQSLMHTYRLRLREGYEPTSRFDPKPKYKTVWQGKNLLDLRHKTFGIKVEGNGQFSYFFEYLEGVEDGIERWEHCGDPRF